MKKIQTKIVTIDLNDNYFSGLLKQYCSLPGSFYWKDIDGIYLWGNQEFFNDINCQKSEEIIGKTDRDIWPKQCCFIVKNDKRVVSTKKTIYFEEIIEHNTQKKSFIVMKSPLENSAGKIVGIIGNLISLAKIENYHSFSVDEIKEFEQKSRLSDQYLKSIIESVPGSIYWKSKEGVWLGCNRYTLKTTNSSAAEDIIGKTDYELWPDQAQEIRKNDLMVINTGCIIRKEESVILPNGKKMYFAAEKMPLRDTEGKIIGIIGNSIDITELKKTQEELVKAKEVAEAASYAKTEFIANMSHDIRTPLTGVIGLSEILENSLKEPEQKEQARMLRDSGEELLSMLNDILDTVDAGKMNEEDIYLEIFDLYQCIEDLVKLERPTTLLKHLDLQVEIQNDVPKFIKNDRKKIHRVLLNLLGNAIKFTQKGHIKMQISRIKSNKKEMYLQFSVLDTGIGIPEEIKNKIFERFFRSTPSYKGIYKGHGLGLHIARSYVELLGGHMTLSSEEGVGTTFSFVLPSQIVSKDEITSIQLTENADFSCVDSPESEPKKNHNNLRILLVEDNLMALRVLESMVVRTGHHFQSTQTGEEARELIKLQPFDLVITDIGLPGISGNQLATEIRQWEKSKNNQAIPIVGLTGHTKEEEQAECLRSGMNGVFTKPINFKLMQSILKKHVLLDGPIDSPSSSSVTLGPGLPETEEELFKLEHFPIFDIKLALETVPDQVLLLKLLREFIAELGQNDITVIQTAYLEKNWDEIASLAHKFKSGAVYLGIARLEFACQYLERYYKAGHRSQLEYLYQQLIEVNQATVKELEDWLKRAN